MSATRSKATRVYGDSRAAWYLDGQYYDASWNPVSHEQAALPAIDSDAQPEPEAEAEPELPSYTVIKATPAAPAPAAIDYDQVVDRPVQRDSTVDATFGDDRLLRLKKLNNLPLARMVMKAGGTPATGMGAKKKNIEWLLENVKD